jgi:hypothetical protein
MQKRMIATLALGTLLAACATDPEQKKNKIEFGAHATTLVSGTTSDLWVVSKTSIQADGSSAVTNPYTFFHLVSSDTNVAAVIRDKQLVGKTPGTAQITAHDDKSTLVTENAITVTVTAAP